MKKDRMPLSLLALYKETFISSIGCLEEIGRKLVAYSERENKHLSLLILDIDNLRGINRKFGYEKGNEVLITLADSMEESLRKSDVAGKYEGGSFLVILPNTDISGALKVEERIRKTFEDKIKEKDFKDENITFSVSIASFPEHGDTFDDLLNNAFACLKKDFTTNLQPNFHSSNKVVICNLIKKNKFTIGISDLVKAMEERRLFPVFQKVLDFKAKNVYGYEVLMRMISESGEIIPAYVFIDLVYSSNIIYAFEEYVIDMAIKKIKNLDITPRPKLFINMPLRIVNIFKKNKKRMKHLLEDMVNSQDVVFEISERKEKEPLESIGYLVNELKSLGFGIALDDFGTENSSFQKLNVIRPDIVKLDRFFLREGKDMLSWLVEGLKSSGYKILVEGVETEEDAKYMEKIQPDFVQGFYYGRPAEGF
ncbi:bifunctional diguanylate cyclase/phosphodiesterase [Hydrogenobaculum acidophilum]